MILTSLRLSALLKPSASAYHQSAIVDELVLWDLEVVRRWAFAYPAGRVVMGTVAWAEPPSIVTSVRDRYAAEMGAHTDDHQPLCNTTVRQMEGSFVQ